MKLYRISQSENNDYDTYDSAVVAAESAEDAIRIHPSSYEKERWWEDEERLRWNGWAPRLVDVVAEYVGEAKEGMARGVIVASFNAG